MDSPGGLAVLERRLLYLGRAGTQRHGALVDGLRAADWEVESVETVDEAVTRLGTNRYTVGLTFVNQSTLGDVESVLAANGKLEWVALTDKETLEDTKACQLISFSFYDYHTIPVDLPRLLVTLGHAHGMAVLRCAGSNTGSGGDYSKIIGNCTPMKRVLRNIERVAARDFPVLITGESGTGKELIAREIHKLSARSSGPFVAVNSGALAESLIQSELFGHEKGAFTGADRRRIGRFEAADGGTILLDEIGDLSVDLQVILLRVLEEGVIQRVGGTKDIAVDVRVIAATNSDLKKAIHQGTFREDLYYRLNVFHIEVPPLSGREGDVESLALYFLEKFANGHGKKAFSMGALNAIRQHPWPGNIRELINRVQSAVVVSDNKLIRPEDLGLADLDEDIEDLEQARAKAERDTILRSLGRSGNNMSRAAKQLGVSRVTLYRLIRKHAISVR